MNTTQKKAAIYIPLIAAVVFILLIFCPNNVFAKTGVTKLSFLETSTKTVKKYDVTNDGKKDTVKIKATISDNTTKLSIIINGKTARTFNKQGYAHVRFVTLKNGKTFICASFRWGYDEYFALMKYKSGKLKNICSSNTIKGCYAKLLDSISVSGNTVKVNCWLDTSVIVGMVAFTYKYKDGTLKLKSNTATSFTYTNSNTGKSGKPYMTTKSKLKVYTGKSCKTVKFTAAKNTKMKITKIYLKSGKLYYQIKTKSGKTGWIKDPSTYKQIFKESELYY